MKIFVTGGSGYVGSHLLPLLKDHQVTALVRSDEAAAFVSAHGATPVRGTLTDLEAIKVAAADADATLHLAFDHSFFLSANPDYGTPSRQDVDVINTIGELYAPLGKTFIMTSGTLLGAGQLYTESVTPKDLSTIGAQGLHPRALTELAADTWGERGARAVIVRLAPTVHGGKYKDWSFMRAIVDGDRKAGFAAVVGDGSNSWPAVNVTDAAELYVLALEYAIKQSPGTHIFHGVAEQNTLATYAEIISKKLNIPVKSATTEEVLPTHGFIGAILGMDNRVSSEYTQKTLGWRPKGTTMIQELEDESPAFFA